MTSGLEEYMGMSLEFCEGAVNDAPVFRFSLCLCFSLAYSVWGVRGGGWDLSRRVVAVPAGRGGIPPRLNQG